MSSPPEPEISQDNSAEQLELKLPDESSAIKDLSLWAGVLILLALVANWPSTSGTFIWRDDRLQQSRWLFAPGGLWLAWAGRWEYAANYTQASPVYQPVALTAYLLEFRAGGKTDQGLPSPMAYHVANLVFHALAAVLLWLVIRELLVPGAWVIAALFTVHPIHSEPVSWISAQPTVLAGLFSIASIFCYLMFIKWRARDVAERADGGEGVDPAQTWGLYGGSILLFMFGVLSEPSAAVIPLVIWLVLWWRCLLTNQDKFLISPMILIGAVLWIVNADAHTNSHEVILLHDGLIGKTATIGRALWFSVTRVFVPLGFSVLDFAAHANHRAQTGFFIAIAVAVALSLAGLGSQQLLSKTQSRSLFTATAIFFLLVCASLNWFDAGRREPITDGVAYLAIIPLLVVVVVFLSKLRLPGPHPQTAVTFCAAILLVFGLLSWVRTYPFQNPVALWHDVLSKDPDNSMAHGALAEQLRLAAADDFANGNTDEMSAARKEAIQHCEIAVQKMPFDYQAQRTWANVLLENGDASAAMPHFAAAIAIEPQDAALRLEYASALLLLGHFEPAIPELNKALLLDPLSSSAHELLGEAYQGMGGDKRAMQEYELALQINPGSFLALQKLAELQTRSGKPEDLKKAIVTYFKILGDKTQVSRPDLWLAVAKIKHRQGDLDDALTFLKNVEPNAKDDPKMLAAIDDEIKSIQRDATTRPSMRTTLLPATMPLVPQ